jgi:tRNA nucleotidyltransferase/poly(A) polymerase
MFYDPVKHEVIDYVGGQEDIRKKLIRTIGSPEERFSEDYLRMLRAIRFSTELDFDIDADTCIAIAHLASNITAISAERITLELEKIICSPNSRRGISDLITYGLAEFIFPEKLHYGSDWYNLFLISDGGLSLTEGILRLYSKNPEAGIALANSLKLSNNQIEEVKWCYANLGKLTDNSLPLHELRPLLASQYADTLISFELAILQAAYQPPDPVFNNLLKCSLYKGQPDMPEPLLNGNDLIKAGIAPGPELGALHKALYKKQLDMELLTREQAFDALRKIMATEMNH